MIIIDEKGEKKKYHLGESLNGVSANRIYLSTREIGTISNLQEYIQNTLRSRIVPGGEIVIRNYVDGMSSVYTLMTEEESPEVYSMQKLKDAICGEDKLGKDFVPTGSVRMDGTVAIISEDWLQKKAFSEFLHKVFANPQTENEIVPVNIRGHEEGLDHIEITMKDDSDDSTWRFQIKVSEV